jgi:hypothetical protein
VGFALLEHIQKIKFGAGSFFPHKFGQITQKSGREPANFLPKTNAGKRFKFLRVPVFGADVGSAHLEHIHKIKFGAGKVCECFNADFFQAIELIYGYGS